MRRSRGFTIVELLVVISVITLLITMLVPALGQARTVALDLRCKTTERGMTQAALNYATDQNEYLPHGDNSPWYGTFSGFDKNWYETTDKMYNYFAPSGQEKVICGVGQLMYEGYLPEKKEAIGCPQSDFREQTAYNFDTPTYNSLSQGNGYLSGLSIIGGAAYYRMKPDFGQFPTTYSIRGPIMKLSQLQKYPETPASYEDGPLVQPGRMAFFADHEQAIQALIPLVSSVPNSSPLPGWARVHPKGFNVGYLDGHVRMFEDPARSIIWSNGNVQYYGSGWGMRLMDEE